jgi:hypothetical protein
MVTKKEDHKSYGSAADYAIDTENVDSMFLHGPYFLNSKDCCHDIAEILLKLMLSTNQSI